MPRVTANKTISQTPPAPETLDKIGREHWEVLVRKLVSEGNVMDIDLPALEMACSYWSDFKQAENPNDKKRATELYLKIVKMFGVTPESRGNLEAKEAASKKTTEDEYVGDLFDGIL